jgi:hypothetical protein
MVSGRVSLRVRKSVVLPIPAGPTNGTFLCRYFLDALGTYCEAVVSFARELLLVSLGSRGFTSFRSYLQSYVESEPFRSLLTEVQKLNTDLSSITYTVNVRLGGFTVRRYEDQVDYTALDTLFSGMANREEFLLSVAESVVLGSLDNDLDTILYRQSILKDCLSNPEIARGLYALAREGTQCERRAPGFSPANIRPGSLAGESKC